MIEPSHALWTINRAHLSKGKGERDGRALPCFANLELVETAEAPMTAQPLSPAADRPAWEPTCRLSVENGKVATALDLDSFVESLRLLTQVRIAESWATTRSLGNVYNAR